MNCLQRELDLALSVVKDALMVLCEGAPAQVDLEPCDANPKELKALTDRTLDAILLEGLRESGYPILSEESGFVGKVRKDELRWIVDPLDGTVNYARNLGSCSISIALCRGRKPLFGVIGQYPTMELAWGGAVFDGAFLDGRPLTVSEIRSGAKAVLCTGIPSRFDYSPQATASLIGCMKRFGKIRMLGTASLSLLCVAKGAAEAYTEQEIMLWDVAAGVAIVEGAGGVVRIYPGREEHSCHVFASNGVLGDWEGCAKDEY